MAANVRNIEAIREFRASLIVFMDDAVAAVDSMAREAQRALAWIEQDRPHYWEAQTRRAFDQVGATRTAYETCRMRTVAGRRSSCIEEKQAFEKAKRRLEFCHGQKERVQRWAVKTLRESDEFRTRLSRMRRLLESDVPKAIALLQETAEILESYAHIAPPESD